MLSWVSKLLDNNERKVARYWKSVVEPVNKLEAEVSALPDIAAAYAKLREEYKAGKTLDELLPMAFALGRESGKRFLGMRHYDVQLIGGTVLHEGKIAEMKTGEGKTLVATLAVVLNAIPGKGVHLVTVNDYLARRDAEWMAPVYRGLGLTVGVVQNGSTPEQRRQAYLCDVTYVTNSELGFDYLRDNMAVQPEQLVLRHDTPMHYAIIDEVDSILIDEARTPLIISGPAEKATDMYYKMAGHINKLEKGEKAEPGVRKEPTGDYTIDEKQRSVHLTVQGIGKAEKVLNIEGLFNTENMELAHMLTQAIRAKELYHKDRDYIVQEGTDEDARRAQQVVIVDEFTGRLMPGRRYGEGLHQAIEAKEGVKIERENQTLATVTYQNFFRLFEKRSGMTGTAKTEEKEFQEIYGMDVNTIPTNRPIIRDDTADVVWRSEKGKFLAVVEDIAEKYEKGQPILVGTISVEKSERLSAMLKDARHFLPRVELRVQGFLKASEKQSGGEWDNLRKVLERPGSLRDQELEQFKHLIPGKGAIHQQWEWLSRAVHTLELIRKGIAHRVLNAKYHEQEAEIVAQAGRSKTVTISTNMAGRGTDIKLGGNAEYLSYNLLAKEGYDHRADWKVELFIQKLVQGDEAEANRLAGELGLKPEIAEEIKRLRDACAADAVKVKEAGGLFILGTERHESRRIDNQLRGRAGRQGDPGGSRFMVSFDDDLMRLFASETVIGMLDRMGFDDSEPIENQMVTRSIERAQKRVEDRNFATRKQLLQFDDVMARQREVVYGQRRSVLLGPDEEVRDGAINMIEDAMGAEVENALNPQIHAEDWDIPSLRATVVDMVPGLENFDFEPLRRLKPEESGDQVVAAVREQYTAREGELSPQIMRAVERFVTLQVVDNAWKEHLHNLDVLRQGIGLRGYGQRDPFQEYKIEGTKMFNGMIESIKTEVTKLLFRLRVEVEPTPVQTLQPVSMSHGGQSSEPAPRAPQQPGPQIAHDPFTVQRSAKNQNRPGPVPGMSRAERRKMEREEKKKKK